MAYHSGYDAAYDAVRSICEDEGLSLDVALERGAISERGSYIFHVAEDGRWKITAEELSLVNLTPRAVTIRGRDGETVTVPPSGVVPRLHQSDRPVPQPLSVDGVVVDVVHPPVYDGCDELPPPERGVLYIVPAMVAEWMPYRDDLVSPGRLIRDAAGRVVGCEGLVSSYYG